MQFPEIRAVFDASRIATPGIRSTGDGDLPAWFEVTWLAVESIGIAGAELAALAGGGNAQTRPVAVDRRLASFWFNTSLRPLGWSLPPVWDAIAGDYPTQDGWIRLHTNAPHHKAAALSVLGLDDTADRAAVTPVVREWDAETLELAVIEANGCAAMLRSRAAWNKHPQGAAVAREPLIAWLTAGQATPDKTVFMTPQPLAGIKVLDMTRILAGPVATRFLAAYGADVLRIDPPWWDESSNAPEMALGKRCAELDLNEHGHREIFEGLVRDADLMVHGYRPDALAGLGYGTDELRRLNPRLIDVALCAYGWTGPWAGRRGFDSLVQMSSGIAEEGMRRAGADKPQPLPVQALDHATGYLMAGAAIHALNRRRTDGCILSARLSLARTAELLATSRCDRLHAGSLRESDADQNPSIEETIWGPARRLEFPLRVAGLEPVWRFPAGPFRSSPPVWSAKP